MQSDKHFSSHVQVGKQFAQEATETDIKNEPMFFNCGLKFAYENGGPITRSFLTPIYNMAPDLKAVFDSRVHMLMPGWFPAIPGFHHDDVPRPPVRPGAHFISAGQPDYDNPRYHSIHFMGLVNARVAPTEFAVGECTMPCVPDGELIYRRWHEEVERLLANGTLSSFEAPDRHILGFNWQSFHRGVKARHVGWRWFGRVSYNTDRVKQVTNEIRRQVQVYLEFPMEGW